MVVSAQEEAEFIDDAAVPGAEHPDADPYTGDDLDGDSHDDDDEDDQEQGDVDPEGELTPSDTDVRADPRSR